MATLAEIRQQYPEYEDMSDSDLAYSLYRKFYSDMPVAGFAKQLGMTGQQAIDFLRVAGRGGDAVRFSDSAPSVGGAGGGIARGALQGLTLGAGDEIVAAGAAAGRKLLGDERAISDIYSQELQREQQRIGQFREEAPVLAYGSEIAGSLGVPLGTARSVKGAAALGGATGLTAGFLTGEGGLENRLTGAATGGILGALLGGGMQAAAGGITRSFENYMSRKAAQAISEGADSVQQLRQEANAAYEAARNAGVRIDPVEYQKLIDDVTSGIAGGIGRPVRAALTPKSADVLSAMRDFVGKAVGIDDLEYIRQLAQAPASMITDKAEQRAASMIISGIDDFMTKLTPDQVTSNPNAARAAVDSLQKARDLWGRMRRSELIQDIINTAKSGGYAGGFESGLKTRIGTLLRNPKLRRGFSEEELKLLSQIQLGTPIGKILSAVSYLGFSPSGGRSGLLTSGGVWGGLLAAGGPIPAAIGAALTSGLRYIREMSLEKQARLYADILASGKAAEVAQTYPEIMRYLQAITTRASTGVATSLPSDIFAK